MPALQVRIARTFKLGIKSLLVHKLRSGLTMLGLVFGVFSVIAMLAIGEGSKREALEQIRQLGANTIIVRSVKPPEDSSQNVGRSSYVAEYGLKYTDFNRVADTVPSVTSAIPIREMRKQFWYLHRSLDGRLVATTRRYIEANRLEMAPGRRLPHQEEGPGDNGPAPPPAVWTPDWSPPLAAISKPIGWKWPAAAGSPIRTSASATTSPSSPTAPPTNPSPTRDRSARLSASAPSITASSASPASARPPPPSAAAWPARTITTICTSPCPPIAPASAKSATPPAPAPP